MILRSVSDLSTTNFTNGDDHRSNFPASAARKISYTTRGDTTCLSSALAQSALISDSGTVDRSPARETLIEKREVSVDVLGIERSRDSLRINLPERAEFTAQVHRFDNRGFSSDVPLETLLRYFPREYHQIVIDEYNNPENYSYTWQGGGEDGLVTLHVAQGRMVGRIDGKQGTFVILPDKKSGHTLRQLDVDNLNLHPEGWDEQEEKEYYEIMGATKGAGDWNVGCSNMPAPGTTTTRIDVLMLYTPEALAELGSEADVRSTAVGLITDANTTLKNSQKDQINLRLAHTALVPEGWDENSDQIPGTTANLGEHLAWVSGTEDPGNPDPRASILALRDQHFADIVTLLVSDGAGACGLARIARDDLNFRNAQGVQHTPGAGWEPFAYSVVQFECGIGFQDFAHEFGHLAGLEHDIDDSDVPTSASKRAACPGSFAEKNRSGDPSLRFRTAVGRYVGSASCSGATPQEQNTNCPGIPVFSNQSLAWAGNTIGLVPVGTPNSVPVGEAPPPFGTGGAQNHLTMEKLAPLIAQYREDPDLVYRDSYESF